MVGPQDTYEAGPNVNEVLPPNPGTNILTTNHIYIYMYLYMHREKREYMIACMYMSLFLTLHPYIPIYSLTHNN